MPSRIWGTVIAGVHFFSPQAFGHQEPGRDEREGLMVVPALPIPNLVVRQTRFALSTLNTLLDAMFGLGHSAELANSVSALALDK